MARKKKKEPDKAEPAKGKPAGKEEPSRKPEPAPKAEKEAMKEMPAVPARPAEKFETIESVEKPHHHKAAEHKAHKEAPEHGLGHILKTSAVLLLLLAVVLLAYYYLVVVPADSFVPGSEVDSSTFTGILSSAQKLYIVMDVRDAPDEATSTAILQCGVDFAASNGTGGKTVTPLSVSRDGCVAPDGMHQAKDCFALLPGGLTIYVKEGTGGVKYYSNGMVVSVSKDYKQGTCGIKRY